MTQDILKSLLLKLKPFKPCNFIFVKDRIALGVNGNDVFITLDVSGPELSFFGDGIYSRAELFHNLNFNLSVSKLETDKSVSVLDEHLAEIVMPLVE